MPTTTPTGRNAPFFTPLERELIGALQRLLDAPNLGTREAMRSAREAAQKALDTAARA